MVHDLAVSYMTNLGWVPSNPFICCYKRTKNTSQPANDFFVGYQRLTMVMDDHSTKTRLCTSANAFDFPIGHWSMDVVYTAGKDDEVYPNNNVTWEYPPRI